MDVESVLLVTIFGTLVLEIFMYLNFVVSDLVLQISSSKIFKVLDWVPVVCSFLLIIWYQRLLVIFVIVKKK